MCQFIAKVSAVCGGSESRCAGSIDRLGLGFGFALSCAECTVAFGARKAESVLRERVEE